jgi:hypothetical protein
MMIRTFSQLGRMVVAAAAVMLVSGAVSHAQAPQSRKPPKEGALRGAAAAKALRDRATPPGRVQSGGDVESLIQVLEANESAWVTPEGEMFFADVIPVAATGPGVTVTPSLTAGPPPTPSGYGPNGMPIHHSLPGAQFKLYLDFDGDFVSSRFWRFNRTMAAYTLDGDPTQFNAEEQAVISRVWGRVAEDYAPFGIDVTTERPVELQRGHPGEQNVLWSIFTRFASAGFDVNVFGVSLFSMGYMPFGTETPTFTFFDLFRRDDSALADTASHEGGHMFGLLHDGQGFAEYYAGHGTGATSWGPIMGSPFGRNVTQWSLGDYAGGTNPPFGNAFQDDVALIAGKLGMRADDGADESLAAAPVALPTRALITAPLDVDVYALPNTRGVDLTITGFRAGTVDDGGNLDVAAEIVDANGLVVAAADDHEQTVATLSAALGAGPHYLRVRSSSNPANYTTYGSLGEFTVSGRFANVAPSFTAGGTVSAFPAGPYNAIWATGIAAGPESESSQQVTFELSGLTQPALFATAPQIDASGQLSFVAAGATGVAEVTVRLRDDGGTDLGGVDTSEAVALRIELRHGFSGFASPLPADVLKAGRTVPVKFALLNAEGRMPAGQAGSIAAVAEVHTSAAAVGTPLASQACAYDASALGYQCDLKLPQDLVAGQTYWIVAKYLDTDGWVRPAGGAMARTANPLSFVAK